MERLRLLLWCCALLAAPAAAQSLGDHGYKHAENHERYRRELPGYCCDGGDCRETLAKFTPEGWFALVDGVWQAVPERAVLRHPDGAPRQAWDQRAHVCADKYTQWIFCFLAPRHEG